MSEEIEFNLTIYDTDQESKEIKQKKETKIQIQERAEPRAFLSLEQSSI